MPMQYTEILKGCDNDVLHEKKTKFLLIFAQNIEAVLISTHNLCFRAKYLRKILYNPVNPNFTI